jgi:hypothetical protein
MWNVFRFRQKVQFCLRCGSSSALVNVEHCGSRPICDRLCSSLFLENRKFCETGIHETDEFTWARITTPERFTSSSNSHLMVIRASLSGPIQSSILSLVSADVTCVTKRIKLIHSCRLRCMLSGGDGRRRKETQEGAAGVDHGPGNRALHEHRRTGEELPPATSLISSRFVFEIFEVVRALPTVTLFVEELYICRFKILLSRILSVGSFARVSSDGTAGRSFAVHGQIENVLGGALSLGVVRLLNI